MRKSLFCVFRHCEILFRKAFLYACKSKEQGGFGFFGTIRLLWIGDNWVALLQFSAETKRFATIEGSLWFSALCDYETKEFEKFLRFSVKEIRFPSLKGDISCYFGPVERMRVFLSTCGKDLRFLGAMWFFFGKEFDSVKDYPLCF